jgi:uncharacterized SAM-binding protein YcdF (DUF218 family)
VRKRITANWFWNFKLVLWRKSFPLAYRLAAWTPAWIEKVGMASFKLCLPPCHVVSADAIVVLGRGGDMRQERLQLSARLWQQGHAPVIFVSGSGDALQMVPELLKLGIPEEAIQGEPCSNSTRKNAFFTAALLLPQRARRILLVTDLPHMPRACQIFRSVGFHVTPAACALPKDFSLTKVRYFLWREWLGFIGHALAGHYRPCSYAESPSIKIEAGQILKAKSKL